MCGYGGMEAEVDEVDGVDLVDEHGLTRTGTDLHGQGSGGVGVRNGER